MGPWIALAAAVVVFLFELKTSRSDGTLRKVAPFRRMMGIIMPTRNESVVYFDSWIDAEALLAYVEKAKALFPTDITHCVVAAANIGLQQTPQMNRFTVGRRLYDRKGRWLTFSVKRKKLDREAKLSAVKMEMLDQESFADFCKRVDERISVERSGKRTSADLEYELFELVPRLGLQAIRHLAYVLDYYNLLPGWFIASDAMYTSVFVANLGSLGMSPGYHHLYEWGTCPLFVMVGKVEERPVVRDGQVVVRRQLLVRYSFDERIEDGLNARFGIEWVKTVLEDPEAFLGCLEPAQSRPMVPPARPLA